MQTVTSFWWFLVRRMEVQVETRTWRCLYLPTTPLPNIRTDGGAASRAIPNALWSCQGCFPNETADHLAELALTFWVASAFRRAAEDRSASGEGNVVGSNHCVTVSLPETISTVTDISGCCGVFFPYFKSQLSVCDAKTKYAVKSWIVTFWWTFIKPYLLERTAADLAYVSRKVGDHAGSLKCLCDTSEPRFLAPLSYGPIFGCNVS